MPKNPTMAMNKQYSDFGHILFVYWKIYGGAHAIVRSPYFLIAVVAAILSYPLWWNSVEWASLILGAIPNILGFSIGAFAVILSFGQSALDRLKHTDETKSHYLRVIASFVHFIVVQALSLIVAFIGKGWNLKILSFVGTVLGIYAISLAVAAAFRLFRLARVYNQLRVKDGSVETEAE
jgi:hypothetical protein